MIVNERPINLTRLATQFIHVNSGSIDAFALAFLGESDDELIADKCGIDAAEIEAAGKAIEETQGDVVIMVGSDLSPEAQALIAASAGSVGGDGRRVLLHPLPLYNNSVGAIDVLPDAETAEGSAKLKALLVAGSLQDPEILRDKNFVVVQELFETETTAYADVVLPAAS